MERSRQAVAVSEAHKRAARDAPAFRGCSGVY